MGQELEITRSRPYHKNDQARVEQKNYTHVREFLGYERVGYQQLEAPLEELCRAWSLWNNLYRVQMKQLSSRREGSKRIRRHEKNPRTATQRIMEKPQTPEEIKMKLQKLYERKDPFSLHEECERGLKYVDDLLKKFSENEPQNEEERDKLRDNQNPLKLRYTTISLA